MRMKPPLRLMFDRGHRSASSFFRGRWLDVPRARAAADIAGAHERAREVQETCPPAASRQQSIGVRPVRDSRRSTSAPNASHSRGTLSVPTFPAARFALHHADCILSCSLHLTILMLRHSSHAPPPNHRRWRETPTPTALAASAASNTDSASLLGKADQGRIRGDSSAKLWVIDGQRLPVPLLQAMARRVFATARATT